MRHTENLGLALYDAIDKMNITGAENSLNHNMELLDAEVTKKVSMPESGMAGQVLTMTEEGIAWQDVPAGSDSDAVRCTAQELSEEQQIQARKNISAADAQALDALDVELNGRVVDNTFTETYACTAGKALSNLSLFDVLIPVGVEYSFSIEADGIIEGGVTLYEEDDDGNSNKVTVLKPDSGFSVTHAATLEIHSFGLYAAASAVTGSGDITMHVTYSSDNVNSVKKRLSAVEAGVYDAQDEIDTIRAHSDELYAIINGTDYVKTWKNAIACTAGTAISTSTPVIMVDIKTGQKYTVTMDRAGVTNAGITTYAYDAGGNSVNIGILKDGNSYSITAVADRDIASFSIYIAGGNVAASGSMHITVTAEIPASGALSAQVAGVANALQEIKQDAMRGSSVMGFHTVYAADCLEIGTTLNNDNNATYVFHDIEFDITADECVGVRVGSVENVTAGIIGYVFGSADGTEYTQLFTYREPGVYHVYPPVEHTKIRVRFYPSTTGGLDEITAKFRDVEIFTSSDGRRRLASAYAPRTWDVPAYYLRGGYLDGKIDEILSRVDASGGDCDVFFFTTDQHWRWNTGNSPALVGYLARRLNIERLFFGGDWADGYTENGILAFKEAFNGRIYHALGNHDYMDYWCRLGEDENRVKGKVLTPAMATFQTVSRIDGIVMGDTMYGYYYVDNPTNRMRYIVMQVFTDESAVHLEQAQLDWLDGVLAAMPEGYLAVVFAHFLANIADDGVATLHPPTGGKIAEVCDKYAAKVAGMFCGHMHIDGMVKTDGGIPVFATTCDCWYLAGLSEDTQNPRVPGTRTEQVIDVVIVDRTNRKVSAVRIGCPARVLDDTTVEVREQTFAAET